MTFDHGAALHCARITVDHYHHLGRSLPPRLKSYVMELEKLVQGFADETKDQAAQQQSEDDLIGADEAARLIACSPQYVRRIYRDLEGQRVGGVWVFSKQVVIDYAMAKKRSA